MEEARKTSEHQSSLPGFLGTIDSLISRIESFALAAGVLLMAANTVANVIGRFIFQHSIFFTEELNRIIIILITFAGVGYAARHGRHIRMSAIFDHLPVKPRKLLMIVIALVTSVSMFALCYFAVGYIAKVQTSGRVLPIEVKAGTSGSLKSLQQFAFSKNTKLAIRFDLNPASLQQVEHTIRTATGNKQVRFTLLSLPLYGVQELERIVGSGVV